jgi:hypothetical protein
MRAYRTLPLVVGLAWGLSLSDAQAAPPGPNVYPLHVLELATDDADDQAKALSLALRARVRASFPSQTRRGGWVPEVLKEPGGKGPKAELKMRNRLDRFLRTS